MAHASAQGHVTPFSAFWWDDKLGRSDARLQSHCLRLRRRGMRHVHARGDRGQRGICCSSSPITSSSRGAYKPARLLKREQHLNIGRAQTPCGYALRCRTYRTAQFLRHSGHRVRRADARMRYDARQCEALSLHPVRRALACWPTTSVE